MKSTPACALALLLMGCSGVRTYPVNVFGALCTEVRQHHGLSAPTIWVTCEDNEGHTWPAYPFPGASVLSSLGGALGGVTP